MQLIQQEGFNLHRSDLNIWKMGILLILRSSKTSPRRCSRFVPIFTSKLYHSISGLLSLVPMTSSAVLYNSLLCPDNRQFPLWQRTYYIHSTFVSLYEHLFIFLSRRRARQTYVAVAPSKSVMRPVAETPTPDWLPINADRNILWAGLPCRICSGWLPRKRVAAAAIGGRMSIRRITERVQSITHPQLLQQRPWEIGDAELKPLSH